MEFGINDKMNFCLMTSSNYITKALVMYDSLVDVLDCDFNFFYFSFDEVTFDYINKLNYQNIIPIKLADLENFYPELKQVKNNRSIAEYFFTCTPHIVEYSLKNFDISHVIYLDADLYFYNNPKIILTELKDNSVLITEHRYFPPKNNHPSGKYCVQFIPFINDKTSNEILGWWRKKCIEWCYLIVENGKWADQGYLNNWPNLFRNVVVMENRGGGIANWNIDGYSLSKENKKFIAFSSELNKNIEVIFYHFQGFKIFSDKSISLGIYKRHKNVYDNLYKDYIIKINQKEDELIKKIKITRSQFNFQKNPLNKFNFLLNEMRRIFFPKDNDNIIYYKFLNKYRWLP